MLWLDVEKGRDTTMPNQLEYFHSLWLDVEKGRDTTMNKYDLVSAGCGLM